MPKMTKGLIAAALASSVFATGAARANVVYTFTTTNATNSRTGQYFPVSLSFDLADAAVEKGSFSLDVHGGGAGPSLVGDVADFTDLTFTTGTPDGNDYDTYTVTHDLSYGGGTTDLTFNSAGDVTSTAINDVFFTNEVHLSGTGTTASGYGASDADVCYGDLPVPNCSVTGTWTHTAYVADPSASVPEPATFAVLSAGLLGLAGWRRLA